MPFFAQGGPVFSGHRKRQNTLEKRSEGRLKAKTIRYHNTSFPPKTLNWEKLLPLLGPAHAALARYDSLLRMKTQLNLVQTTLENREAILSCRIESITAKVSDVLTFEAGGSSGDAQLRESITAIINYRNALRAIGNIPGRMPVSKEMVCALHRMLFSGSHAPRHTPGQYRTKPMTVKMPEASGEKAHFIPAAPESLPTGMNALRDFFRGNYLDTLVQIALFHMEFEALHPFDEGNDRLGRLLIPIAMWRKGLLSRPLFPCSTVFERDSAGYYQALRCISSDNDMTRWCRFFLSAIQKQAEENTGKALAILKLANSIKDELPKMTRAQYAPLVLDWIFKRPIFRATDFCQHAELPEWTARRILKHLVDGGILTTSTPQSGQHAFLYLFPALLDIADSSAPSNNVRLWRLHPREESQDGSQYVITPV
ncbi:MAG: Fic family protein [bacterium]|nr:Fic family protein [bacterium]